MKIIKQNIQAINWNNKIQKYIFQEAFKKLEKRFQELVEKIIRNIQDQ
jgi:cell fate (sporulation/competence/biofilm development) regulator YlbF (YheA/YmcA/DUF963 family)